MYVNMYTAEPAQIKTGRWAERRLYAQGEHMNACIYIYIYIYIYTHIYVYVYVYG